jgi:histidinol-phosphate aminotransferase
MTAWPSEEQAAGVVEHLLTQGFIVRPLASWGLPRCVRISIGTEEEIAQLEPALASLFAAESLHGVDSRRA